MKIVTCIAPVNIAVIKYWGKRDDNLILPLNDSLSATLSTDNMCAKTTIMASAAFKQNRFWLNGKEETFNDNSRLLKCIQQLQKRSSDGDDILKYKLHICSVNDFPTAAGLASSAAGYACLVSNLATLYSVPGDISAIARLGSGSACRSVLGGWVQWHRGECSDGSDSKAKQVATATHWPQMRVLVLVVNDMRKKSSSTNAMKRSVETSKLLAYRAKHLVDNRIQSIKAAIEAKDFQTFGRCTMEDSNQFHAICLDTYPPCVYMNDVSHAIVDMVHAYNQYHGSIKVAYTFDAGPNACLYLLEDTVPDMIALITTIFPPVDQSINYIRGSPLSTKPFQHFDVEQLNLMKHKPGLIKYIIYTKVGDGPKILTNDDDHLLNKDGLPK